MTTNNFNMQNANLSGSNNVFGGGGRPAAARPPAIIVNRWLYEACHVGSRDGSAANFMEYIAENGLVLVPAVEVSENQAIIASAHALADLWEHNALRWEDPLPVDPKVEELRKVLRSKRK